MMYTSHLLILLRPDAGIGICHFDGQLLSTLHNLLALLAGNVVGNLGRENAILHHQHLQFPNIVEEELLKAIWAYVLGLLGRAKTNVWHEVLALEAPAHSVVNTLGLAPVSL